MKHALPRAPMSQTPLNFPREMAGGHMLRRLWQALASLLAPPFDPSRLSASARRDAGIAADASETFDATHGPLIR